MARCRRVTDPESGVAYYLSASFRRNEADNDDVFDLEVTDFHHAWVAKGVSRPEKGAIRDQWMAVAREALAGERSPHLPGDKKFSWTIAPHDGHPSELKVLWTFEIAATAGATMRRYKAEAHAHKVAKPASVAEPLARQLLDDLSAAQAKCKYLEGTCEGLKRELKLVQDDIDRRLTVREAAEELLYAKFAAVLNESHRQTKEAQDEARVAQADRERIKADLSESEGCSELDSDAPTNRSSSESGDGDDGDGIVSPTHAKTEEAATVPMDEVAPSPVGDSQRGDLSETLAHSDAAVAADAEETEPPRKRQVSRRKKRPTAASLGKPADLGGDFSQLS